MTEPTTLAILGLLFGLGVKHLVLDFGWLQPPFMFLNKGKLGHPGGILHSMLHVVGTCAVLAVWILVTPFYGVTADMMITIIFGEFLWHYFTDLTKVRVCQHYGWKALPPPGRERDARELAKCNWYWFITGADQLSHFCTYLMIAWVIITL